MEPTIEMIRSLLERYRELVESVGTSAAAQRFDRDPEVRAVRYWIKLHEYGVTDGSPDDPVIKKQLPVVTRRRRSGALASKANRSRKLKP